MPIVSFSTFAIGARQLVVQEAFEMIVCWAASYRLSLTPITIVMSSFLAGAEMMTFFAPLSMCVLAFVASVKKPVDSMTTSAPMSPQCRLAGSRSAKALNVLPPTEISVAAHVEGRLWGRAAAALAESDESAAPDRRCHGGGRPCCRHRRRRP